jgi:hypothetical protein
VNARVLGFAVFGTRACNLRDKRRHERVPVTVEVELVDPAIGKLVVNTKDLSDGGLFLRLGPKPWPGVGSTVTVRLNQLLGGAEPPLLKARVVRETDEGVGLEFLLDDAT